MEPFPKRRRSCSVEPGEKGVLQGEPADLTSEVRRLLAEGLLHQAAACCEREAALFPKWSQPWFLRGFVHDVAHEHEQVASCMRRALELDPSRADAWLFLAECDYRRGDFEGAFRAFDEVCHLDPGGPAAQQAMADQALLRRNLRCVFVHRNVWQPETAQALLNFSGGPDARGASPAVRLWDAALPEELFGLVRESVDDLCVWRTKSPAKMNTFWLDRSAEPRTATELAGRALLRLLGQDHKQYRGIEWWCRNQAAQMGAHFHYDTAISGCEGAAVSPESLRPTLSSVLYLGDVGGPTMILNQVATSQAKLFPPMPDRGWTVATRRNRWLVFPGNLFHGAVSFGANEAQPTAPRFVILFNFWAEHRPAAPSCQAPNFQDYMPVCSVSPTARHLLPDNRIEELQRLVQVQRNATELHPSELCSAKDMPRSVIVEDFPFGLPLPVSEVLAATGICGGFLSLNFHSAAASFLEGTGQRVWISLLRPLAPKLFCSSSSLTTT
ncbi:unnamed protein product [Symbiodinium sp. CCMP2456]|nr:unnamed protein product [Symbiodinium sp. CCMP2456]